MAQAVASVVSDLHPYLSDMRSDAVYAVIELDDPKDRPRRALVTINGIRKGDRVKVSFQDSVEKNKRQYIIIEKVSPTAPLPKD